MGEAVGHGTSPQGWPSSCPGGVLSLLLRRAQPRFRWLCVLMPVPCERSRVHVGTKSVSRSSRRGWSPRRRAAHVSHEVTGTTPVLGNLPFASRLQPCTSLVLAFPVLSKGSFPGQSHILVFSCWDGDCQATLSCQTRERTRESDFLSSAGPVLPRGVRGAAVTSCGVQGLFVSSGAVPLLTGLV